MTEKYYKSSWELCTSVKEITDMVLEPDGTELAYNAIKAIAQLNDKFYREFGGINPDYVEDGTNAKHRKQENHQGGIPILSHVLQAGKIFKK